MSSVHGVGTGSAVPACTAAVVAVCAAVQLYVFLFDPPLNDFTLSAALVIYAHQFYRIVTAAFFHGGLMHIGMNMMSMLATGASLERSVGTVQLLFTVLWQTLLTGAFCVGASWFLSMVLLDDMSYIKQQSVGFSGVLFALVVVDIHKSDVPTRSVMGFVSVPSRWYPWALLVLLQLMIPNVSFLGHFAGIMLGTWQANGGLRWLLPSVELTRELEAWPALRPLTNHPRWVSCPDGACGDATLEDAVQGLAQLAALARQGVSALLAAVAAAAASGRRATSPSLPSHDRGSGSGVGGGGEAGGPSFLV